MMRLIPGLSESSGQRRQIRSRRGVISIFALVVLLLFSAMTAQLIQRVLSERRQMRQELRYAQAARLAEAGELAAVKALSSDPNWAGIQWQIPAGVLHQTNSASVVINVRDGAWTVVARYPANDQIPIQVTRTGTWTP